VQPVQGNRIHTKSVQNRLERLRKQQQVVEFYKNLIVEAQSVDRYETNQITVTPDGDEIQQMKTILIDIDLRNKYQDWLQVRSCMNQIMPSRNINPREMTNEQNN